MLTGHRLTCFRAKSLCEDLTMSLTMRCPDVKAMELGGVETGSMKAYEHPTVAGIMKYRGFTETRRACRDKPDNQLMISMKG